MIGLSDENLSLKRIISTSTYAVAVSSDGHICLQVSLILALGYLSVFFFSTMQIAKLWLDGAKLSHRRRVFLRLISCGLGAFLISLNLKFFFFFLNFFLIF